jgi:hypothetical protein
MGIPVSCLGAFRGGGLWNNWVAATVTSCCLVFQDDGRLAWEGRRERAGEVKEVDNDDENESTTEMERKVVSMEVNFMDRYLL